MDQDFDFTKFFEDPAVKAPSSVPAVPASAAPDLTSTNREAGAYVIPSDKDHLSGGTEVIDDHMAAGEEHATRYVKPADIEEFAPLDEQAMLKLLAEQTGLRVIDLASMPRPDNSIIRLLTADQAERLMALPVAEEEDGPVIIAVADPANPTITDDLRAIIDREIEPVIASDREIRERIEQYYGIGDESLEDVVSRADGANAPEIDTSGRKEVDLSDMDAIANAPPVIKLVNLLLLKAIKARASDIHIEPFPNLIRIRYRVDGVLREIPSPPRQMLDGILSRIKVMGNLDIAEQRLPQDGRIKLTVEGREVDLRVSTVPTVHGESIVMRVLDKSMMMIGISQIGMTEDMLERFKHHIGKPNGIVLATGPTGCGKTTTLYASINEIKDPGEKLITVEDPVEYQMDGILQININDNVGLTFAKCLRAILRHDPDKVLVGEIRDVETAQIAVQASLTGHLVFSTLHTNSASATMTRLIDMGIEPFLITSSVEAVIGQRLVRTICSNCRVPYTPSEEDLLGFNVEPEELKDQTFFHGEGCHECTHSGYKGRMGLFELLEMTDEMRELILDQGTTDEVQDMARRHGMVSMRRDGWYKVCMGLTTFEEVLRETPAESSLDAQEPDAREEDTHEIDEKETRTAVPRIKERKALPKFDPDRMSVDKEAGARITDIGDARRTSS